MNRQTREDVHQLLLFHRAERRVARWGEIRIESGIARILFCKDRQIILPEILSEIFILRHQVNQRIVHRGQMRVFPVLIIKPARQRAGHNQDDDINHQHNAQHFVIAKFHRLPPITVRLS